MLTENQSHRTQDQRLGGRDPTNCEDAEQAAFRFEGEGRNRTDSCSVYGGKMRFLQAGSSYLLNSSGLLGLSRLLKKLLKLVAVAFTALTLHASRL